MRSLDDVQALIAFFEARQGQVFGFRWKDWSDFKSGTATGGIAFDDQVIAQGDGVSAEFQLAKRYVSGAQSYLRPVTKPVAGTVRIGVGGDELFEGVHYTVDTATGLITLTAVPGEEDVITAGFEFDVPVRFDTDRIQVSVASFRAGDVPNVPVVEVRV